MAYCRWSSDNWKCDLYCYESDDGYVIHTASNRIVGKIPKVNDKLIFGDKDDMEKYTQQYINQRKFMRSCTRRDIKLPFAGSAFWPKTLQELADKLIELRNLGYRFPDYVFDEIHEEMKQEKLKKK